MYFRRPFNGICNGIFNEVRVPGGGIKVFGAKARYMGPYSLLPSHRPLPPLSVRIGITSRPASRNFLKLQVPVDVRRPSGIWTHGTFGAPKTGGPRLQARYSSG